MVYKFCIHSAIIKSRDKMFWVIYLKLMFYASAKKKKKKKKNTRYPYIQVALAVFFYAYRVTLRTSLKLQV